MDAFECDRDFARRRRVGIEQTGRFEHQERPQPLAAAEHRMPHRVGEPRRRAGMLQPFTKPLLDCGLRLRQPFAEHDQTL